MTATPLHDALGIDARDSATTALVATVGGGGKTTLLFALAEERAAVGGFTILTTTTKFTIPPAARDLPTVLTPNALVRAAAIDDARRRGCPAIIVGSGQGNRGRVQAVDPSWPNEALDHDLANMLCVEADGAAGRAFKAPADHEPVLPDGVSHVLAVVAVTILGKPLDGQAVHRPECVAALTGAVIGQPVSAELVAAVLAHARGGRKNVPTDARFAVVVTHAASDAPGAMKIAEFCYNAGIDRVVAFDAQHSQVELL